MKITEAVELLETFRDEGEEDLPPDVEPAINLGIEALKQLQGLHKLPHGSPLPPLTGETPEK